MPVLFDRHNVIIAACLTAVTAILVMDLLTPLGLALNALYSVVVVFSLYAESARVTRNLSALCTALVVVGALLAQPSRVPLTIVFANSAVFVLIIWIMGGLVMVRLRSLSQIRQQQLLLESANRELERMANIDVLTGLANRRHFNDQLANECAHANRMHAPLSLLMIDVDFFKSYNDTLGHQAGDKCLRAVADTIRHTLRRPIDIAARYGGEEFAVILPSTSASGAHKRAEAIREAVRALKKPNPGRKNLPITVSIGVATAQPPIEAEALIRRADQALYRAKTYGRDRVAESA